VGSLVLSRSRTTTSVVLGESCHVVDLELPLQAHHGARGDGVLEPRKGRLRRQPARVVGEAVTRGAPERVVPKRVGVVLILVAERDLEQALTYLFETRMNNTLRRPRIGQQGGDAA